MIEFNNIEPWFDTFPRIEFQTPEGLFDLHNNAELLSIRFQIAPPVVAFEFRHAWNWEELQDQSAGFRVLLQFHQVSDLQVRQAPGYDYQAAATLEGVEHLYEQGVSIFSIDAGDVECQFRAEGISLSADI